MFEGLTITDNAKTAHNEVMRWLKNNRWVCLREIPTMRSPTCKGYIDIVAVGRGKRIAIEVDRRIPREKSLYKLENYKADERYVLLRGGNKDYTVGTVRVISLKLKT